MILRAMRALDVPGMRALWIAAWEATFPDIDFAARGDWLEGRLVGEVVCAVEGDAVCGFITIGAAGEIDQLAVAPAWFGRGVGTALLAHARERRGRLRLSVNQGNPRAVAFYRREGFRMVGGGVNPQSGLAIWEMEWP